MQNSVRIECDGMVEQKGTTSSGSIRRLFILLLLLERYSIHTDFVDSTVSSDKAKRLHDDLKEWINRSTIRDKTTISEVLSQMSAHFSNCDVKMVLRMDHTSIPKSLIANEAEPQDYYVIVGNHEFSSTCKRNVLGVKESYLHLCLDEETVLNYEKTLFPAYIQVEFINHYQQLLKSSYQQPDSHFMALELCSMSNHGKMGESIGKSVEISENFTLLGELQKMAATRPDLVALTDGQTQINYKELNQISDSWAIYIQETYKIKKGSYIVLWEGKGVDLVITFWAILKLNCIIVPVDFETPLERVRKIESDCKPALIIARAGLQSDSDFETKIVRFKDLKAGTQASSTSVRPAFTQQGKDHLYCIYTSGSTGVPKGVQIQNRSLWNLLLWMKDFLNFEQEATILHKTTHAFDVAIWEIFLPVLVGARLVVPPQQDYKDLRFIGDMIVKENVTFMAVTPSELKVFLKIVKDDVFKQLTKVVCGGEVWPDNLVHDFFKKTCGKVTLYNFYGPTETTIDVAAKEVSEEERKPSIGTPVWNTKFRVVDKFERNCPNGVPGELWISGIQVPDGYLNDSELNKERFVHCEGESSKVFKTRDLAYLDEKGDTNILGRMDNQVKLRGFRIELEEIESHLDQLEFFNHSVVSVINNQLVCFYVKRPEQTVTDEDLKNLHSSLKGVMPEYMCPTRYVEIHEIPLSTSGKCDRKSLPRFLGNDEKQQKTYNEGVGKIICESIKSVLKITEFDSTLSFYSIGGDSLSVFELLVELESRGLSGIKRTQITKAQSIEDIILSIDESNEARSADAVIDLDKNQRLCTHREKRLYQLIELNGSSNLSNIGLTVKLRSSIDESKLQNAIEHVFRHAFFPRSIFKKTNAGIHRELLDHCNGVFERKHSSILHNSEHLKAYFGKELDLASGPLLTCAVLADDKSTEKYLIVKAHHIVSDGYSLSLFIEEVVKNYYNGSHPDNENSAGIHRAQTEKHIRYINRVTSPDSLFLQDGKAFWEQYIGSYAPRFSMKFPSYKNSVDSFDGESLLIDLSETAKSNIKNKSTLNEITPNCCFAFILAASLAKWANESQIMILVQTSGRDNQESASMLGYIVNAVPLILKCDLDQETDDLLSQSKHLWDEIMEYQSYPYELISELLVDADPDYKMPQVFLNIHDYDFSNINNEEFSVLENIDLNPINQRAFHDITIDVNCKKGNLESVNLVFKRGHFTQENMLQLSEIIKENLEQTDNAELNVRT